MREPGSPERRAPRETDCGRIGSAELFRSRRRRRRHRRSGHTMTELPGVREGGMPGRNGQRKPGTTRGSPRRSRTAKALRISRHAVKSQCARGWGGWGRLSDDGARQHNLHPSEDPWGGGLPHLHGGARSNGRPDTPSEMSALQPYRGKPAVRNDRGDRGNVGIIEARSAPRSYPTAGALSNERPLYVADCLANRQIC